MCAGVKWNLLYYMIDSWYSLPAKFGKIMINIFSLGMQ